MSTKFVTLLWMYGAEDLTPYSYFFSHYDPSANLGAGVDASATGNWEHFQSDNGAALLKQFKTTLNKKKQRQIAYQLEKIWLDNLPAVPLFVGPRWSTYSTKYWTGFPTIKNAYVDPIFSTGTQVEKILLTLRPVGTGKLRSARPERATSRVGVSPSSVYSPRRRSFLLPRTRHDLKKESSLCGSSSDG